VDCERVLTETLQKLLQEPTIITDTNSTMQYPIHRKFVNYHQIQDIDEESQ